ncbi:Oidioi.mRNA.OKI2018_I69.XSR.g13473.t1.cds [Oikopleura dioica]|uniref:Oidioi.mRNA.OKI2018_I69.XSR.g13473.t1.cds n=1 Tax=Oikopleura dioica TaxID=34765 RepID=A0ABN7S7H0_OIKDI|nr:Oidioi.mRNA.OKI2018_I69.XSR.g13473.t1.cds [Oikopleura dioica]
MEYEQATTSQEQEEPVYAELKTVVLEEVPDDATLQAGTSGAIDGHFVENAGLAQDVQFQVGEDIPGFYDGPWTPGQDMVPEFPEYPEQPEQPAEQAPQFPQYPEQAPPEQAPQHPRYPVQPEQPAEQAPQYPQYPEQPPPQPEGIRPQQQHLNVPSSISMGPQYPQAPQYPQYPQQHPEQVLSPEEIQHERDHLNGQIQYVRGAVAEAIKKQPSLSGMYQHIHCLAIAECFTKEFAEIYTNIYVHFMVEHNLSRQPTEELNKMGSQIALNYVINYSCVFSKPYQNYPPPHHHQFHHHLQHQQHHQQLIQNTPGPSRMMHWPTRQPIVQDLKWNRQLQRMQPQSQPSTSGYSNQGNYSGPPRKILKTEQVAQQEDDEEEMAILEEVPTPPIHTLPRDDAKFGKWPFEQPNAYGYINDPKKPHDLFSVFEPHLIHKDFQHMERMKAAKEEQAKSAQDDQPGPSGLQNIKTERAAEDAIPAPGHGYTCLPVQCDVIKPKCIKLLDGTTYVNGVEVDKNSIVQKQTYKKLPSFVPSVTRSQVAAGEQMAAEGEESPFDPKPYWNTDAAF